MNALVLNFSFASKQLARLPGKISLNNKLVNSQNNEGGDNKVKTIDDFAKLSFDEQKKWKDDNPDAYKMLFAK